MILETPAAARFIGASDTYDDGDFVIFGVPFDSTTSFRPGARFGPEGIRSASDGLETYSPMFDVDLDEIGYADMGDIPVRFGSPQKTLEAIHKEVAQCLADGGKPVMLGGEHSLTPAAFRAVAEHYNEVVLLQLDAHADLRHEYLGEPLSHACAMWHCVQAGAELMQVGIRSGTREEWTYMRDNDTLVELADLANRLNALDRPVYVTIDLDAFDPSLMSGTGTPEPGGLFWRDFEVFVGAIAASGVDVVAFDVMELAPRLDPSGVSAVVGAKVVREMMAAVVCA